jgi:hypothetical protein
LLPGSEDNVNAPSLKPFSSKVRDYTTLLVAENGDRTAKNPYPTLCKSIKNAGWFSVGQDFNCSPTSACIYTMKDNIGLVKQQIYYLNFKVESVWNSG